MCLFFWLFDFDVVAHADLSVIVRPCIVQTFLRQAPQTTIMLPSVQKRIEVSASRSPFRSSGMFAIARYQPTVPHLILSQVIALVLRKLNDVLVKSVIKQFRGFLGFLWNLLCVIPDILHEEDAVL